MIRTELCKRLGIEVPIVLAPFGPWDEVALAAAVSDAGALGSIGTAVRGPDDVRADWHRLRELTDAPVAINHTGRPFNEEAFVATLDLAPPVISFHMGVPTAQIAQAHDRGILWMQTVGDVATARAALDAGADVLVAQGAEAGGNAGWIASSVLVPAVVDVAGDVPVVAAGGIADGRGIAAALSLGARGVSLGTRFLATPEMNVDESWKRRIVEADAADAAKVVHSELVMPPFTIPQIGPRFAPRALRTPLIEQLELDPDRVDAPSVGAQLLDAVRRGGGHDLLPFAGQTVGLIHDIVPAADLVDQLMRDAEAVLREAAGLIS